MQLIAVVHIIRRVCHARSRCCRIATISANSFGRNAFSILDFLLLFGVGLSTVGRFDGATGLRICLPSVIFADGSRFNRGGGDVKGDGELGIEGIGGIGDG